MDIYPEEDMRGILSFTIAENAKKVTLFNCNDRTLNYAIEGKENPVELDYPAETVYKNPDFKFDSSVRNRSIRFTNKNAVYKIYDKPDKLGIEITADGKTYDLAAERKTKIGGLEELLKIELDNVIYEK